MMLDHLRAFAAYDTAHDWNKVVTRTEAVISEFTGKYSSSAGLLSDFVVGANTTSPEARAGQLPGGPAGQHRRLQLHPRALAHGHRRAALRLPPTAAVAYATAKKESACLKSLSGGNPAEGVPAHQAELRHGNVLR